MPTATSDIFNASANLLAQVIPCVIPAIDKPPNINEFVSMEIPPCIKLKSHWTSPYEIACPTALPEKPPAKAIPAVSNNPAAPPVANPAATAKAPTAPSINPNLTLSILASYYNIGLENEEEKYWIKKAEKTIEEKINSLK